MPGILLDTKQKGILESVATLLVRAVPNSPTLIYCIIPSLEACRFPVIRVTYKYIRLRWLGACQKNKTRHANKIQSVI